MKKDITKLSYCARLVQNMLFSKPNMGYQGERVLSIAMFMVSILWFSSAIQCGETKKYIYSSAFGLFSIIWFLKSGCSELSEKKHINKNSNQSVDPTLTDAI